MIISLYVEYREKGKATNTFKHILSFEITNDKISLDNPMALLKMGEFLKAFRNIKRVRIIVEPKEEIVV